MGVQCSVKHFVALKTFSETFNKKNIYLCILLSGIYISTEQRKSLDIPESLISTLRRSSGSVGQPLLSSSHPLSLTY